MKRYALIAFGIAVALALAFVVFNKPAVAPNGSASLTPSVREPNISILSPKAGDIVTNPIRVTGKARVFEATFAYRLKDANGGILLEGFGMTTGASVPEYGDFDFKLAVPAGSTRDLVVEVFEYSAKDGSVVNLASVPVRLTTQETSKVKVFFSNIELDPPMDCTKVFPVERQVIKTQEIGLVVLFELLRGPLAGEERYHTNIPKGTILNSLVIKDGTAYADFNHVLELYGGGSCRVQAIRAQIEATLKQFPTVKRVVISVNGRTEGILQP